MQLSLLCMFPSLNIKIYNSFKLCLECVSQFVGTHLMQVLSLLAAFFSFTAVLVPIQETQSSHYSLTVLCEDPHIG